MNAIRYAVFSIAAILAVLAFVSMAIYTTVSADFTPPMSRGQLFGYVARSQIAHNGEAVEYYVDLTVDLYCDRQQAQDWLSGAILDGDGVIFQVVSVRAIPYVGCAMTMREIDNPTDGDLLVSQNSPLYIRSVNGATLPDYRKSRPLGYVAFESDHAEVVYLADEYAQKVKIGDKLSIGDKTAKVTGMSCTSGSHFCHLTTWGIGGQLVEFQEVAGKPIYLVTK